MRRNKTKRNTRRNKRKGGAATAFPLKYFDVGAMEPQASPGHDLLKAIPPIGVRPRIGGKHRKTRRQMKKRKQPPN